MSLCNHSLNHPNLDLQRTVCTASAFAAELVVSHWSDLRIISLTLLVNSILSVCVCALCCFECIHSSLYKSKYVSLCFAPLISVILLCICMCCILWRCVVMQTLKQGPSVVSQPCGSVIPPLTCRLICTNVGVLWQLCQQCWWEWKLGSVFKDLLTKHS